MEASETLAWQCPAVCRHPPGSMSGPVSGVSRARLQSLVKSGLVWSTARCGRLPTGCEGDTVVVRVPPPVPSHLPRSPAPLRSSLKTGTVCGNKPRACGHPGRAPRGPAHAWCPRPDLKDIGEVAAPVWCRWTKDTRLIVVAKTSWRTSPWWPVSRAQASPSGTRPGLGAPAESRAK